MCQSNVRYVRTSSGVSEGFQKDVRYVRRSPCVSEGHQVCKKLIRCVRRSSGLSKEGYHVSE